MRVRITFQSIISKSPMIVVGLSLLTAVWIMFFLYAKLYKPITQAETIIIIRSESSLQLLDYRSYEKLKQTQEARRSLKQLEIPVGLNPFIPQASSILTPK